MSQSQPSFVSLEESQITEATELLARVFQHDPMMIYFVIDTTKMLTKPARFYRANIKMGLLYGEVHTTPELDAIAVWLKPGNTDFAMGQMIKSGLLVGTLRMGFKTLRRFMTAFSYVDAFTKRAISRPHYLLVFLAVDPAQQGKGIGAKLIAPMLERADAEGVPCYLESMNERNLSFYKRHGFEVAAEGQIPKGGPKMWGMIREPK